MISPEQLSTLIQGELPDAQIQVEDLTGGGDHYQATVVSEAFAGKTLVQQHQMVYKAVNSVMANESLHALALKTFTPEKWAAQS
ncbi:MAG: BolA family transcriptional regulator [Acaryochloridaceae cyanobacterium RL_2_7]|nr:BolA family transcriptional regulator [Acaryochloridaceae cyanobacterium RL_2_7]